MSIDDNRYYIVILTLADLSTFESRTRSDRLSRFRTIIKDIASMIGIKSSFGFIYFGVLFKIEGIIDIGVESSIDDFVLLDGSRIGWM